MNETGGAGGKVCVDTKDSIKVGENGKKELESRT